jgi:hypothetical protein
MKLKQQLGKAAISWAVFILLCVLVQPSKLPIIILVVPFVLLYFALYNTWLAVALVWGWASGNRGEPARRKQLAAAVSSYLVLLAIMSSLGQLKGRDVLTLGLIFGIAYFYLVRWRSKKQT